MRITRYLLIIASFILASCSLVKPYKTPAAYAPESWKGEETINEGLASPTDLCHWWDVFEDPVLTQLELFAVDNNKTLEAAFHNYMQAKALTQISRSYFFPYMSLDPNFTKREGPSGFGVDLPPNPALAIPSRSVNAQYTVPLNVSYEVDLWGQILNGYRFALYHEEALQEAVADALLSITADLAENYFIMRSLDAEKEVLEKNITLRRHAVEINQARYDAGLVNYTDVSRARTELANAEADFRDVIRQRKIQEDIIATLSGAPAPEFSLLYAPLKEAPPEIPAGVPAMIITQRPDLRQMEREIASAWADVGVAYSYFFPSLNLMGSIGYQSIRWHELLDWKTRFWMYTISVAQMVFDGGATSGNVKAAKEQYLINLSNYQQRVLVAFQEVEDALASIKYRAEQESFLYEAASSSRETYTLSKLRYDRGLVTYLEVVDAERSLLEAERASVRVFGNRYLSTVQLIRSLGGTWISPLAYDDSPPCLDF